MSHDPSLILKYGDGLERHNGERILNRIPSYATIWATFVGNDGVQNPLPMQNAVGDAYQKREKLWQYLYTLFESLALSWEIEQQFKECEQIGNQADYARNLNSWTAFYAHLGRIHDMAEKVAAQLEQDTLFASFDPFYESRHIALHGIKVPMLWVENVLCAPNLGEAKREWHLKMDWGELGKADFDFISNRVSDTLRGLETVIETFCAQVLRLLPHRLGLQPISWPKPKAVSGALEVRGVPFEATQSSIVINPSGVRSISDRKNYG